MARDRKTPDGDRPPPPLRESNPLGRLTLGPLTANDLPAIVAIEQASFSEPWSPESFREVLASRTFETLGARTREGTLCGYIIYSEVVDELHVLNVAIHPSYRRMGLGTAMLAYLHGAAVRRGRAYAYLEVRESNRAAQKLYAKLGYRTLSRRPDYYPDTRESAIVMGASLRPEPAKYSK